jgi:serine/threonine protein phosphatase PrpC
LLRIAEQFHASDLGRQRQGNEDNYFVRAPLFVVADGMGGAQAGEVASEMAVESFDAGLGNGSPAEGLVRVIQEANRRIHDRSRSDEQAAGMGTTCTAAYVGEDEVTIAHVGDSRAYLWRDGELTRLTRDHSLVGELVARGKLTEEQAEAHPQRSVITRALGPEREVQVDVETFAARDGDIYLLCSDGLTSMIHEHGVQPVLERTGRDLDRTGRELIAAANEAGGRDNITVILFRLEEVGGGGAVADDGQTTISHAAVEDEGEYEDFQGDAAPGSRQGTSRPYAHTRVRDEQTLRSDDVAGAVRAADEQEAAYRASGTVALSAIEPRARAEPDSQPTSPADTGEAPKRTVALPNGGPPSETRREKKRRFRVPGAVVVVVVLLAMVLGGFWLASQAVYFVGTDPERGNAVTIYRGLPVDLPLGLELYSRYQASGVTLQSIPASRRQTFTDHKLRSKDDAENLVIQLERGQLES